MCELPCKVFIIISVEVDTIFQSSSHLIPFYAVCHSSRRPFTHPVQDRLSTKNFKRTSKTGVSCTQTSRVTFLFPLSCGLYRSNVYLSGLVGHKTNATKLSTVLYWHIFLNLFQFLFLFFNENFPNFFTGEGDPRGVSCVQTSRVTFLFPLLLTLHEFRICWWSRWTRNKRH